MESRETPWEVLAPQWMQKLSFSSSKRPQLTQVLSARFALAGLSTVPQKMQKYIAPSFCFLQAGQLIVVLALRDM